jgi:hypothetical protein
MIFSRSSSNDGPRAGNSHGQAAGRGLWPCFRFSYPAISDRHLANGGTPDLGQCWSQQPEGGHGRFREGRPASPFVSGPGAGHVFERATRAS